MTTRAARKAENRAKLLEAARRVFAEKGLGASTVRDIVRETDLASGTFYNYFHDKEEAFRAVLEEFTGRARAAARHERLQPGVGIEDRVVNAYRSYFELVIAEPEMFTILSRDADAVATLGADNLFDAAVSELAEDMGQWIDEGQLPTAVAPWLPLVARTIAGGAFQVAAALRGDAGLDPDAAARFCADLLFDGLRNLGG